MVLLQATEIHTLDGRGDMRTAQAIDGSTMEPKDRCVQCRKTFGYDLLVEEHPLRGGDSGGMGECARTGEMRGELVMADIYSYDA